MKYLIVFFLVITTSLQAQYKSQHPDYLDDMPFNENGVMEIVEVVDIDASKDELYTKAKLFFAESFNDALSVIELDDPEGGIIIGNGTSSFTMMSKKYPLQSHMSFTIKLELKDDKYRYSIKNIDYLQHTKPQTWFNKEYYFTDDKNQFEMNKQMKEHTIRILNDLIIRIKTSFQNDDNW